MRTITWFLGLGSLAVVSIVAACGDDANSDNPSGSGTTGTGGATSSTTSSGTAGGGGSGGGAPVEPDPATCEDMPAAVDADTTLTSDKCYLLKTVVKVTKNLTIEPGTWIFGDATATSKGTLVILPGGKITADGEEDRPIIFTSAKAKGSRKPGDWGGIIVLGNGVCNDAAAGALCEIEGLTDGTTFGATAADAKNDESSGVLKHVLIQYPGVDLDGQGNEINGLTFGGVGSGTVVSHVMVANTLDDCFEWFGGAVDADHLIAYNCGDDMFDTDSGFSGHVQFAFGRQGVTITTDPNGLEMDNDKTDLDKAPISTPKFSNVTLCGNREMAPLSPEVGAVLRNGTDGALMNVLITGFATSGLSVRNTPNTGITLTYSLAFDTTAVYDDKHAAGDTWFTEQTGNGTEAPAGFGDCLANPPAPFPAEQIAGGTPTGFGQADASYIGAFKSASDNWMTGRWVDWATQ